MLSDPEKRKQYDTFGGSFRPGQGPMPGVRGLRHAHGRRGLRPRRPVRRPVRPRRPRRPRRAAAAAARAPTSRWRCGSRSRTPSTAPRVKVPVVKAVACTACHGSGAAPGTSPTICPDCKGRGVTAESQGFFSLCHTCRRCGGAGTVIEDPCGVCGGSGRVRSTKTYQVRIPAGVKNGTRIKVKGKGEAAPRGGEPGDLYVVTQVTTSRAVPAPRRRPGGGGAGHLRRGVDGRPGGAADARRRAREGQGAGRLHRRQAAARARAAARPAERVRQRRPAGAAAIAVPSKLSKQERETLEKLDELQRASHGNPRDRLFA